MRLEETFDSQPLAVRYQLIRSGQTNPPLQNSAMAVLHIIPTFESSLNLSQIAEQNQQRLTPLVVEFTGLDQQLTDNEALIYSRNGRCYVELLNDGKIETAYSSNGIFTGSEIISFHLECSRSMYKKQPCAV